MSQSARRDLIDSLIADWRHERPDTKAEPMAIVGRILRLGRLYEDEAARMLRPYELSYSDFDVLATLRRTGAPYLLSPTLLQRNVLLSSGAMTACLRRLEVRGLISRHADPSDRRRLAAQLTATGYDLVESLIDQRFDLARASLAAMSASDISTLERLLRVLGLASAP